MATSQRPRVFFDIVHGGDPLGRLTIELFADKTPNTCANFLTLCTTSDPSLSYAKSPFHRIVDEFMVQGGDTTKGDGTGGKSSFDAGDEFEDENLGWRDMEAVGLVCMANRGKDTNSSQFFITLAPCPHLNNKHTIFGHLVAGQDTLAKMAKLPVDVKDCPLVPVLVARCGELQKRAVKSVANRAITIGTLHPNDSASSIASIASRGRKRRTSSISADRSRTRSRSTHRDPRDRRGAGAGAGGDRTRKVQRLRRQSDAIVDENYRGRPRERSHSAVSAARDAIDDEYSSSSRDQHKRKRSASPSRLAKENAGRDTDMDGHTSEGSEGYGRRTRRRSLPNQYLRAGDAGAGERRDTSRSNGEHRLAHHYEPRRDERRDERRGGRRGFHDSDAGQSHDRRQRQSYRPSPRDGGRLDQGRLGGDGGALGGDGGAFGGAGGGGEGDAGIKFKGRGKMKYREPDRAW